MAKTINTNLPTVSTGDVLTATAYNNFITSMNSTTVPPMIRVRRNAAQSIAGNVSGAVNFDAKDFDTDWGFTASSNLLTVGTTGVHFLTATVDFQTNGTGTRGVAIFYGATVSGATDAATITAGTRIAGNMVGPSSGVTQTVITCSTLYNLTAGDKIAVMAYQNSGGNLNTQSGGSVEETSFSAFLVGRTS